jgi:hypothetical protein
MVSVLEALINYIHSGGSHMGLIVRTGSDIRHSGGSRMGLIVRTGSDIRHSGGSRRVDCRTATFATVVVAAWV